MKAYEFATTVTPGRKLVIPDVYSKDISVGGSVRVILLVEEQSSRLQDQEDKRDELLSLAEVIADIKNSPQNPANVQPASGLLADHLANSPEEAEPDFDVTEWNRAWDDVEAKMKMMELAEQAAEVDLG